MAQVRQRFTAAIVLDAVFVCFILLSGLVHALSRGHEDGERRAAAGPFIGHLGHGAIGLAGLVAIAMPVASLPVRVLTFVAPASFVGDVLAFGAQLELCAAEDETLNEYALFAVLAVSLAASALSVYWASRRELSTFNVAVFDRVSTARQHRA